MSGLAKIMLQSGYKISGSDTGKNFLTDELQEQGAIIYQGHRKEQIKNADLIIFSSAIGEDNPEKREARIRGVPLVSRGEFSAWIANGKQSIVVAGTHGKTTTTALIAELLLQDEQDPTLLMGGILKRTSSNSRLGKGRWIVLESDESDASFLLLHPDIAVITNIEDDHLDYYGSRTNLYTAFYHFFQKVRTGGTLILNLNDPGLAHLLRKKPPIKNFLTYGLRPDCDIQARDIRLQSLKSTFKVVFKKKVLGNVEVPLAGVHNIFNCLAAIAVGIKLRICWETINKSLTLFAGIKRRLEKVGQAGSIVVFDDYAHHPTEIEATLLEIKRLQGRALIIFQPHRYTRCKFLLSRFSTAFTLADILILMPIYPAGEKPIKNLDEKIFFEAIFRKRKLPTYFFSSQDEVLDFIRSNVQEGDVIVTMGAGDVTQLSTKILYLLKKGESL